MKTHKILTACLLIMMGMYAKAQIGCQAYYLFSVNGNTVQFNDTSYSSTPAGGTISYSYLWTFSDGSSSAQQDPLHTFTQPGTYNVCLLFSVAQNGVTFCSDTFCNSITIGGCANPPVVTVTGNSLINAGQSTTLTATAALGTAPYFYAWSTGDNTAQITVSPTTTTTYCVTVYDNMQCSASYCHIVQVNTSTLKPLATDDSTCTTPNNAVVIDVLNNDQQLSSPTVSILGTSTGTTTLSPSGALGYEPNTGFNGTAYIYYSVCNSNGLCDTGKVSVWVSPNCTNVNHPPVAQPFTTQMCNTSSGLDIDLFQVTSDPDMNDSLQFTLTYIGGPNSGTVGFISNGMAYYSPIPGYRGQDQFQYVVCDNGSPVLCDTNTVFIYVDSCGNSCPNPPQAFITKTAAGLCDVLTVTIGGGVAPYTYLWNNGTTGSVITVCNVSTCYTVTVLDANGCSATATYCYGQQPTCYDTICGEVFNDINGNGVKDAGEQGISNTYVNAGNYTAFTDTFGHYEIIVPCGTNYIYAYPNPNQNCCVVTTVPVPNPLDSTQGGYYVLNDTSGSKICGFNFGYQNSGVTISGFIYLDANNNGVKDPGEGPVAYQSVVVGGYYTYTDHNGYYVINMPAGNYALSCTPYSPYTGATVSPASISVNATTVGATYSNNNFGIYVQPGVNLEISIGQISTVAPGFPAYYWVDVCNVGTVTTGGVASMYYDPNLLFNYSSPTQTSHNTSAHTLSFNLPTLVPGDCQGYYVSFTLPTSVALGTPVFNLVTVTPTINPDINLTNNRDTLHQIVTGSWDPNNKLANGTYTHPETSTKYILPNTDLEYTVNFQNTGTAPAVNVIIKDELQANIDLNSFKMLGASHNCQVVRDGNKLNFKFSNIMLADSFHNEKESHGFVRFSVKPNTAAIGTIVNNTAEIFFDFNEAVVTNTAENVIAVTTGIDGELEATNIVVAPNPFSSFTTISVKGAAAEEMQLTAFDLTGRIVANQTYANPQAMQFNRNELKQGVYIYELKQHGQLIGKGKLVIE
jgi:uncharacterized repeat protein (TIGR01451 family)